MNIETLNDYVALFKGEILDSGFRRDVIDLQQSLPTNQGNIVALRQIAEQIQSVLARIYSGDLPRALKELFASGEPVPFTDYPYYSELKTLSEDSQITQDEFFSTLTQIISGLASGLNKNVTGVEKISAFIAPYVQADRRGLGATDKAVVSVIFKDLPTTTLLSELTKTIKAWDRALPLYHQLVTRSSPEDISLLAVQNGSIDVVLNLDVKVALGLADLFRIGFVAYLAYLAHKKQLLPIAAGYFGNRKLKELDEQKEKVLLDNIGDAVADAARKQHEAATGPNASPDNPDKVIEVVRNLVTAHIIRGNDVKILALPDTHGGAKADDVGAASDEQKELAEASRNARAAIRELPEETRSMLLERYAQINDAETEVVYQFEIRKSFSGWKRIGRDANVSHAKALRQETRHQRTCVLHRPATHWRGSEG